MWPDFWLPPINLWVLVPAKEWYEMSGGIEDMKLEEQSERLFKEMKEEALYQVTDDWKTSNGGFGFSKSRIDIIGQNGNDGLHYAMDTALTKEKQFLEKLINDHWAYIDDVLKNDGVLDWERSRIGFHYRTAFAHGWKHHKEYMNGA